MVFDSCSDGRVGADGVSRGGECVYRFGFGVVSDAGDVRSFRVVADNGIGVADSDRDISRSRLIDKADDRFRYRGVCVDHSATGEASKGKRVGWDRQTCGGRVCGVSFRRADRVTVVSADVAGDGQPGVPVLPEYRSGRGAGMGCGTVAVVPGDEFAVRRLCEVAAGLSDRTLEFVGDGTAGAAGLFRWRTWGRILERAAAVDIWSLEIRDAGRGDDRGGRGGGGVLVLAVLEPAASLSAS